MASVKAIEFYIYGDVQGVGLRDWIIREALDRKALELPKGKQVKLEGFEVENMDDGSVRVRVAGKKEVIDAIYRKCSEYPNATRLSEKISINPQNVRMFHRGGVAGDEGALSKLSESVRQNPNVARELDKIEAAIGDGDFARLMQLMNEGELPRALERAGLSRADAADAARTEINNMVKAQYKSSWANFIEHAKRTGKLPEASGMEEAYDDLKKAARSEDFSEITRSWVKFQRRLEEVMPDARLARKAGVKVLGKMLKPLIEKGIPGASLVVAGLAANAALNVAFEMKAEASEMRSRGMISATEYDSLVALMDAITSGRLKTSGLDAVGSVLGLASGAATTVMAMNLDAATERLWQRYQSLQQEFEARLDADAKASILAAVNKALADKLYEDLARIPGGTVGAPARGDSYRSYEEFVKAAKAEGVSSRDIERLLTSTKNELKQTREGRQYQRSLDELGNHIELLEQIQNNAKDGARGRGDLRSDTTSATAGTRVAFAGEVSAADCFSPSACRQRTAGVSLRA